MAYEVYTYGGGEALYEVFNAIAALTGGSDYLTLIKLFAVLGLFWVIIEMGVRKTINWHWFLMFMVMFNIFFVPKKNVVIIDRFNPAATYVVANVPFGLAAPAWLFSHVGDGITTLLESGFTLPGDMLYEKTGMVFGSKMMTAINRSRFDDPKLNKNLDAYAKQCIYYNIAYGFYSFADIVNSNNLQTLLFSSTNNSSIRGIFYDNGTSQQFLTCAAAATQLKQDMTPVVDGMIDKAANMLFANQGGTTLSRRAALVSALPAGYAFFSGISVTAQQQLMQAALSNYMMNSYGSIAASVDAGAAATAYATAVAERQQRSAWRTMAELSSRSLPIMRTVFEVIIYSLFFLVFLALMLPATASLKALTMWLKMNVWIQVWPPLFAFLNLVVSLYGKTATGLTIGSITSMAGMAGMESIHSDMALIAGYMAMSIPVFAWGIVTGSGQVVGTMASGLMSPGVAAAGQASGEMARGNISTGNTSMGNRSIMQDMTGPNTNLGGTFNDGAVSQTVGPHGRVASQGNFSDMGVNVQASQGVQHATSTALSQARAQEQTYASNYTKAQANESTAAQQFVKQAMHSEDKGLQKQVMEATGGSSSFESSKDIAHNFASTHGLTDAQAAKVLASASAGMKGGFELFGNGVKVGAEARAEGSTSSQEQQAYDDAIKSGAANKYAQSVQTEHKLAEIASTHTSDAASGAAATSLADAHKNTESAQQQWSDASKRTQQLQQAEQYTQNEGFSTNANMNQYLEDYMREHKIHAGADEQGTRMEIANSEGFAEYALNRSGIHTDLDGDGKTEGWTQQMDQAEQQTGSNIPTVQSSHQAVDQGAAANASKEAGLTPGEVPNSATSKEVEQKLDAGEKQAAKDKSTMDSGQQHVNTQHQQLQDHVQGQDTHLAGRVSEKVINEVTSYPKEAVATAMEKAGFSVTTTGYDKGEIGTGVGQHDQENITGHAPKMGDGFGSTGSIDIEQISKDNST